MEWLTNMNHALDYIENHLDHQIDYNDLARIALCSTYHFQRMFSYIIGVPLAEYIRRRRMTLAGLDIQKTNIKVIELAFKYGYNSPDAFSRAFQKVHGITPSKARSNKEYSIKAFPRISFQLQVKGDVEMNYRIEKKRPFTVAGIETTVSTVDGQCYKDIPQFWEDSINNGNIDQLRVLAGLKGHELLNAAIYNQKSDGTQTYMICYEVNNQHVPEDLNVLSVPEMTWVIFKTEEHSAEETTSQVQSIWKRVFTEWFPTSGYEQVEGPEFEMFYSTCSEKFVAEVWIPIKATQ